VFPPQAAASSAAPIHVVLNRRVIATSFPLDKNA
jgi:hypothetical protein